MKKNYFLLVFFGVLLLCACDKENIDPLMEDQAQTQLEESALKGADSNGLIKVNSITPMPMYARTGEGFPLFIPATEEYGIICFYVYDPVKTVFVDHDFTGWFAPQALGVPEDDWAIEGSSWFQPDNDMPHHYKSKGKGDVPIWVISRAQVLKVIEDNKVTIEELQLLVPPPLEGEASSFSEVVRVWGGGAPVEGMQLNAQGELEDGRKFNLSIHTKQLPEGMQAKVNFHLKD